MDAEDDLDAELEASFQASLTAVSQKRKREEDVQGTGSLGDRKRLKTGIAFPSSPQARAPTELNDSEQHLDSTGLVLARLQDISRKSRKSDDVEHRDGLQNALGPFLYSDERVRGLSEKAGAASDTQHAPKISFQFPDWHVDIQRDQSTASVQIKHHNKSGLTASEREFTQEGPDKSSRWNAGELGDRCPLLSLPTEILQRILLRMRPSSLCALRCCCTVLYSLAGADAVWDAHVEALQRRARKDPLLPPPPSSSGPGALTLEPEAVQATTQNKALTLQPEVVLQPTQTKALQFKLAEQANRVASKFQVLRKGYLFLSEVAERWWLQLQRAHAQGPPGPLETQEAEALVQMQRDQVQWSSERMMFREHQGRAGHLEDAPALEPLRQKAACHMSQSLDWEVGHSRRSLRRMRRCGTRGAGGGTGVGAGTRVWHSAAGSMEMSGLELDLGGPEDNSMVGSEDAGEDHDALCKEESARVRKVLRKLTDMDWSLMYEAVTQIFGQRAEVIGSSLGRASGLELQEGVLEGEEQQGQAKAVPPSPEGLSCGNQLEGEAALAEEGGSDKSASHSAHVKDGGRQGEENKAAAWAALGEWETEWALDMGNSSQAAQARLLSASGPIASSSEEAGAQENRAGTVESKQVGRTRALQVKSSTGRPQQQRAVTAREGSHAEDGERTRSFTWTKTSSSGPTENNSQPQSKMRGALECEQMQFTSGIGSHHGDQRPLGECTLVSPSHCMPAHNAQCRAVALWQQVVGLWGVFRRWLKLVSSHCTLLQFEVMLERGRGNTGQTCTPTVYDKGVICFRNSVLLSFKNRRQLQHALSIVLRASNQASHRVATSSSASTCSEGLFRTGEAGYAVEDLSYLKLTMRKLYQELDVADDRTLPSATFTQEKFRRCFGLLQQAQA